MAGAACWQSRVCESNRTRRKVVALTNCAKKLEMK